MSGEIEMLGHAYNLLGGGDRDLAIYMVRDLEITKAAKMTDICWTADRQGTASAKEARWILDEIAKTILGENGPTVVELFGVYRRIQQIVDFVPTVTDEDVLAKLADEQRQLEDRAAELRGAWQ